MDYTDFKTPKIGFQNVISFTCSDSAISPLLDLFNKLSCLGEIGSSKELVISWDGDGSDRLENITVNGVTLSNWEQEQNRLKILRNLDKAE